MPPIVIERTRDPRHGDFACPAALGLARAARCNARELAARIVGALPVADDVESTSVAGPGFINFKMTNGAFQRVAAEIVDSDVPWGRSRRHAGKRVQVEFVSVNPTGPLHVGHGRGAACGAAVANLLEAVGWEVEREYYVNDAGRQMDILAVSVWLRYLEVIEFRAVLPSPAAATRESTFATSLASSHASMAPASLATCPTSHRRRTRTAISTR